MGEQNSSVTRVWPVFDFLFDSDPTGLSWLPDLLRMGSRADVVMPELLDSPRALLPHLSELSRSFSGPLKKVLGVDRAKRIGNIRMAYEVDVPPAKAFLEWLVRNPQKIQWPIARGEELVYGARTQDKRKRLIAGDLEVQAEALQELQQLAPEECVRKWWTFEGFTSVDCLLETDRLLVLVEGKRTEPVSSSTHWFPDRNQVIRNLECARQMAGTKNYAVLVCAEKEVSISDSDWAKSLPHLNEAEIAELKGHFLGYVSWEAIASSLCNGMTLPETVAEAVELCKKFR